MGWRSWWELGWRKEEKEGRRKGGKKKEGRRKKEGREGRRGKREKGKEGKRRGKGRRGENKTGSNGKYGLDPVQASSEGTSTEDSYEPTTTGVHTAPENDNNGNDTRLLNVRQERSGPSDLVSPIFIDFMYLSSILLRTNGAISEAQWHNKNQSTHLTYLTFRRAENPYC